MYVCTLCMIVYRGISSVSPPLNPSFLPLEATPSRNSRYPDTGSSQDLLTTE
ncbi:hypothetical protein BDV24DRAFT_122511 [Aspergillus arachidicola]|uniref:Uncharacterized protein n=1 Tax=Aspergillus arachidicola TaxID=656916 RepID=A0A5N6YN41_9EURO|nr:hypothetical protein BDV24DRAFT_122511 [Aspergillus arachidicola]